MLSEGKPGVAELGLKPSFTGHQLSPAYRIGFTISVTVERVKKINLTPFVLGIQHNLKSLTCSNAAHIYRKCFLDSSNL